jgi:hypothetical protein
VELFVPVVGFVLNGSVVRGDCDGLDALHDSRGCDLGFAVADVMCAEEELSVEVGDIDGVHINDVYVTKAAEGEVFEKLAAETAGADDEDAAVFS